MSKGVYIGVEGYAHKVTSMYIGVDGVARKIKKAYLGVEGYARLFYSVVGLSKATVSISNVRSTHKYGASASIGSYAIFAGGGDDCYVDACSPSLTMYAPQPDLANKRAFLCGCGFDGDGVFAGGRSPTGEYLNTVECYTSSLSYRTLASLTYARSGAAMAATTNHLVIFGGGDDGHLYVEYAETYDKRLTKSNDIQCKGEIYGCGVSCSGMAWFCDGYLDLVVFDDNMTFTRHSLSTGRQSLAGAAVGNYVLFAGGHTGSSDEPLSTIEAYDSNITKVIVEDLPNAVCDLSGTSVGPYALFGGGISKAIPTTTYSDVAVYDENLTRTLFSLSSARYGHVSASVGDYALFAGGGWENRSTVKNYKTVEVFEYGG